MQRIVLLTRTRFKRKLTQSLTLLTYLKYLIRVPTRRHAHSSYATVFGCQSCILHFCILSVTASPTLIDSRVNNMCSGRNEHTHVRTRTPSALIAMDVETECKMSTL